MKTQQIQITLKMQNENLNQIEESLVNHTFCSDLTHNRKRNTLQFAHVKGVVTWSLGKLNERSFRVHKIPRKLHQKTTHLSVGMRFTLFI